MFNFKDVNGQLIESQNQIETLEETGRMVSSNHLLSGRNISITVRNIAESHRKLLRQVENDLESWLNVQDLVQAFEMESYNLETSLMTVETFLDQSILHDWTSTGVNSKLNEIQVGLVLVLSHLS